MAPTAEQELAKTVGLIDRFKAALGQTVDRLNILAAPLVIIGLLRSSQDALEFIVKHPRISTVFYCGFAILFITALLRQTNAARRPRRRTALLAVAAVVSVTAAAFALTAYTYWSGLTGPVYYPVIGSVRGEGAAVREVTTLNILLDQRGATDLRVRAFAADDGWYMISLVGPHSDWQSADETLRRGRAILAERIDKNAHVYSTDRVSRAKRLSWFWHELTH